MWASFGVLDVASRGYHGDSGRIQLFVASPAECALKVSACSGLGSLLGAGAASRRHSNTLGVAYFAAHKSNHNEEEKKKMKKKEVRVFDISVYWPLVQGSLASNSASLGLP